MEEMTGKEIANFIKLQAFFMPIKEVTRWRAAR